MTNSKNTFRILESSCFHLSTIQILNLLVLGNKSNPNLLIVNYCNMILRFYQNSKNFFTNIINKRLIKNQEKISIGRKSSKL